VFNLFPKQLLLDILCSCVWQWWLSIIISAWVGFVCYLFNLSSHRSEKRNQLYEYNVQKPTRTEMGHVYIYQKRNSRNSETAPTNRRIATQAASTKWNAWDFPLKYVGKPGTAFRTAYEHHSNSGYRTHILNTEQIQRSGFDSRRYQIFWVVVGLERGPLSLVSTIEELLGRKSSGFGPVSREYGRRDPWRSPCGTL
jgi:hypothetical protein